MTQSAFEDVRLYMEGSSIDFISDTSQLTVNIANDFIESILKHDLNNGGSLRDAMQSAGLIDYLDKVMFDHCNNNALPHCGLVSNIFESIGTKEITFISNIVPYIGACCGIELTLTLK